MPERRVIAKLWNRDLAAYPKGARRWGLLLLVVAAGTCLMSLTLVSGSIIPLLGRETGMSTAFYSGMLVVAGLIGALTSYFSALSDRIGRANLITWGLLAAGLIAAFGVPTAHTKWQFGIWYCVMAFADGVAWVGTTTLMRDFTPQTGRATAMGVNTLGSGGAALLISFAASHLLAHNGDWRVMLYLCGGACLAVFVIALFALRELPPHLRAQIVATARDEHRIEQTASQLETEAILAQTRGWRKWRTVISPRTIATNVAIMFYLIIFVTAGSFLTLYYVEVFHLSIAQANSLATLYWATNCVALVAFGVLSDLLMVRKPIMFLGAGIVVVALLLVMTADHPGYWRLAVPLMLWALGMGGGFTPWFAAYSEDAERVNPALVGTNFALFGVASRMSYILAGLVIPLVIGSPVATAAGWHTWFVVCIALMVAFVVLCALGFRGRYRPSAAKAELRARVQPVR